MKVSFGETQRVSSVKLPNLEPVKEKGQLAPEVQSEKKGFSVRETWKDVLKVKADINAYSAGAVNGVKNAVVLGSGLVAVDWLVSSVYKIGKGKLKVKEFVSTPFKLVGEAISTGWKFIFGNKETKNIFKRPLAETLGKIIKSPIALYKRVLDSKNVTKVAKYGAPIVAIGVAAYTTFCSYLNANEQKAKVDHRYGGEVGHH